MGWSGIRGAIDVPQNDAEEILAATGRLLKRMVDDNGIDVEQIESIVFSATQDLDAVPPAKAARELGWLETPFLCVQEMEVSGALPRCIRVLMHVETERPRSEIRHIYLGAAQSLRPDWVEGETT